MTDAPAELLAPPTLSLAVDSRLDTIVAQVVVPAGTTNLWLSRQGPSGTIAYVRGANPMGFTSNPMLVYDYEAPIAVPLTYTAVVADAGGTQSAPATATITIPSYDCSDTWLNDIAAPSNTQRVVIESLTELDYEAASGVHYVLNRRTPIVTSDIARAPKFALALLTATDTEREKTRAALGNGVPILLRTPPDLAIGSLYLMALDWKEQRLSTLGAATARRFLIDAVQVDRPDPILYAPLSSSTYAQIAAAYATYAALKAARTNYDAVLHDPSSGGAADLVPWPPDDV